MIGYIENVAQGGPDTESDLFEMLKGRAVDHWCVNLRTHSFLDASDRRAWRRAVGAVLEDWTDTTPAERIGRTVRTVKDAEAVKSFLDFDAMLTRFEDGVLLTRWSTARRTSGASAGWSWATALSASRRAATCTPTFP